MDSCAIRAAARATLDALFTELDEAIEAYEKNRSRDAAVHLRTVARYFYTKEVLDDKTLCSILDATDVLV